jgi:hypothetical protein
MKKILFILLCFLLLISCKKNGSTSGDPIVVPETEPISIKDVDFRRPVNSNVNWFFSQYKKRISMWLREGDVAEIYINIENESNFSEYFAEFSDNSVCSFSNENKIFYLTKGRNTISITGNAVGNAMLRIYGINNSEETVLISGFDDVKNKIPNRELKISVYHRDYIESVIDEDEEEIYDGGDVLSVTLRAADRNIFPNRYSLDEEDGGYIAYRSKNISQGSCPSCSYFSAVGLLEIETKRHLIEHRDFPFFTYHMDLSEAELLNKRNSGKVGSRAYYNLSEMAKHKWIIPLEDYAVYDDYTIFNNCV